MSAGACRSQKRILSPLELEFQVMASCLMRTEFGPMQVFLTIEAISPALASIY